MAFWNGQRWVDERAPERNQPTRAERALIHSAHALLEGTLVALLVGGLIAGTAFAAKGGNGGDNRKLVATISLSDASQVAAASSEVSFAVTRSIADDTVIWVTNKCFDGAGALLSSVDLPVLWGMWYSLEGVAGPFATDGTSCIAYVTLRPWQGRPLGDAVLVYAPQA